MVMLMCMLLVCLTSSAFSDTTTYFISPIGNNDNDGSEKFPWATVSRAIAGIKQLKQSHDGKLPGPVNIMLQPGTYYGDSNTELQFGADLSGTLEAPITFQSVDPKQVNTYTLFSETGTYK